MPDPAKTRPPVSPVPRLGRGGRKPRTLKQHLLRRLLVAVPAALLMVVVIQLGWLDRAADKMTFTDLSWFDNTALVEHLRGLVVTDGLTNQPGRCLLFVVDGNTPPEASKIDVFGKPGWRCETPKGQLPKLFTLLINRADRTISVAGAQGGAYHQIPS